MRNFRRMTILLILAVIMVFACAPKDPVEPETEVITESVKMYYGDVNNENFVTEHREISYNKGEDKYKIVLEELIKGSRNNNYQVNISRYTKVYGTIVQNNDLIVDLSKEFNRFEGSVAEIIGVGSLVNTMTQIDQIERVKILVEGNEFIGPSGNPRGFMEPFTAESQFPEETRNVVLYFANEDATAVVGEKVKVQVLPNMKEEDFIKIVMKRLIEGPQSKELYRTIPLEVKIKTVAINDKIAYVDFSEEMHTRHWRGAAGECMTINSIVNTLTEFDYIEMVQMTVEGEPMAIEHEVLTYPVARNENMIEK